MARCAARRRKYLRSRPEKMSAVDDMPDELYRQLSDLDRKLDGLDRKA